MNNLPSFIQKLVDHFDKLPGIGPKTATKLVFYLLQDDREVKQFASDLEDASQKIIFCSECQNVSDQTICNICSDKNRNKKQICVVSSSQDLQAVEKAHIYEGLYHILHGTINPIEGITPDRLKITELLGRIKNHNVQEIILALDQTMDGEATAMYLIKVLKPLGVKITRPARGLPVGSNIEYADEVTLSSALENRREIKP